MRTALLLLLLTMLGCGDPPPLNDRVIAITSNTLIQSASVQFPDGFEGGVTPDDYELFRNMFRALSPISSVKSATETNGPPDYVMMLNAAGNIASIRVYMVSDEHFTYQLDGFEYIGGQPRKFVSTADAIRRRIESYQRQHHANNN